MNAISQPRRAALLGALLLAASLPADSLAAGAGTAGGGSPPAPSARPGLAPSGPSQPGAGRHLVLQVRGSG